MIMKIIDVVETKQVDDILKCSIILKQKSIEQLKYAFYIFRYDQRIHISWYSDNSTFEFNTNGMPGYYRVVGFIKNDNGEAESAKSKPIFLNPTSVTKNNYSAIDSQERAYILRGSHWNFPALFYPSNDSNALFVMLPSAVNRTKMELPVFNRWTWANKGIFPGHVLCISDPTLEFCNELQIGWLIGHARKSATIDLANFIIGLANDKGIPHDKIVFYGSSAGGFASLALAANVEGSIAIAINAQTDILSFDMQTQVNLVKKHCFDGASASDISQEYTQQVNMIKRWANVKNSRVLLVQNVLDTHHYDIHFKPFWKSLGGSSTLGISSSGPNTSLIYRQEGGHIPETEDMAKDIISLLRF